MMRTSRFLLAGSCVLAIGAAVGCKDDDGGDRGDGTEAVGTFDGLFDGVADGFNFPFDIGIVPDDPTTDDEDEGGDMYVADYGTSQVLHVPDPSGDSGVPAQSFFDGTSEGFAGATAISIPDHRFVWATFEQGGSGDRGGIVVLDRQGAVVTKFDDASHPGVFARPGGICYGGREDDASPFRFFVVNMDDGSAWRLDVPDLDGLESSDGVQPVFERVGTGLATGSPGNPGTPGSGLTSSKDLPLDGARGCAYFDGSLYVADAQNARIVRFDGAGDGAELQGAALEDTPNELVTYPTDVAVNEDGYLLVISYDNAHAFVSLDTPGGGFIDDGLQDLNVNAGNYGIALALDTIWFTRANNSNGTLRAVTREQDIAPTTEGPFFPQ